MAGLLNAWIGQAVAILLAVLACATFMRRGIFPLHVSALVGAGAYGFAIGCKAGFLTPVAAAFLSVVTVVILSTCSSLLFARIRGTSAALAAIGLQALFEQFVRASDITGGAQGLWQGLPSLAGMAKTLLFLGLGLAGAGIFRAFLSTTAARLVTLDGNIPALSQSASAVGSRAPLAICSIVAGGCASASGIVLALHLGFVSPASFSLHWSLLYVGVIVLTGGDRVRTLLLGTLAFSLLPEVLRWAGMGTVDASAWRGVVAGAVVATLAIRQAPRPGRRFVSVAPSGSDHAAARS